METREKLIQTLKDCGGIESDIQSFLQKLDSGETQDALQLLAKHRKDLLRQFHKCDACIGCLDYLVAQMEKVRP